MIVSINLSICVSVYVQTYIHIYASIHWQMTYMNIHMNASWASSSTPGTGYLEVQSTCNSLRNCSYNPLIRLLSGASE